MTKTVAPHPPLPRFYEDPSKRETFVRDIFDETAHWYDMAASMLAFGSGDRYRRDAVRRAGIVAGMRVLDLATGTGVVARAAAAVTGDAKSIVGMDPSIGMLHAGRTSSAKVQAPAESLPFADASFDRITIGFALRHFADLGLVFRECKRVLRPGGKLSIFEITAPQNRVARALLGVHMGTIAPAIVRLRTGSPRAADMVRYYWHTTRDCVRPEVILDALREAGLTDVKRDVQMAIFSEYSGGA
jgi:demethylmenaquinone methyltransferase / 2-methoxy-6-polyprenyl-1,4-benzoquinol methylase